ncbi:MAG: hypothetical protein E7538_03140 [Ruminococcaceae bacterium]|nr:hypothetical protein [Oscillospiraceae bacterium]
MKKIIAIFLSLLMLCSVMAMPASAAAEKHEKTPIIFIAGSSVDICDADGNVISTDFDVLTDDDEGDGITREAIIESAMNILLPFIMEGLPADKWDNYGDALYDELAPIWDDTQLGGDGNAKYGTGVSAKEIAKWDKITNSENRGSDGKFGLREYDFRYDWRLSPYDHVDRLHEYIKAVIKITKCDQVALVGRCLGGNVITAYLDVYGEEGLVKKVVYDEVMSNGSSAINDIFSGQIELNDKNIQAYLLASEHYGKQGEGLDLSGVNELVLELAERTYDLMAQVGAMDSAFGSVEELYARLYKAFIPAMLKATGIGTWASYWTSLCSKDFDTALNLIFGEEGSEERAEFAGLVEKLVYLRDNIVIPREKKGEENLYKQFEKNYGVQFAVIAGYGLPIPPLGVNSGDNGDITVDTANSSFGATVAGLFETLSDEYIAERVADGYGKYISPDKKIDASTCIFPETTWFLKNKHHDTMGGVIQISEYFTQYTNVTADSNNKNIGRFLMIDLEDHGYSNMTEENMADGPWIEGVETEPSIPTRLAALFRFLASVFAFLTQLMKGEFSLTIK